MLSADPQLLVGATVLSDLRVDALVRTDAALATYAATSLVDGAACTLRTTLALRLPPERDSAVAGALGRIVRHSLGVRALCAPRAAGAVTLGSDRVLAVAHAVSPRESAEDRIASGHAMSVPDVVSALQPVAEALKALHDQGLVHGAVHPAAIVMTPTGPMLSAFGLSDLAIVIGGATAARDDVPPRSRVP
jgi:hypothetical protein